MNAHSFNPGDTVAISNVVNLKNAMNDLLEASSRVRLDFSGVERVDSIGIQLIIAFLKEAAQRSVNVEKIQLSAVIKNAMDRIRFDLKIFNESVEGGK